MGKTVNPALYSPLDLAYIGDTVYELFNRDLALKGGSRPVNKLHKECSSRANAGFQAKVLEWLLGQELLTEEELSVMRRARNAEVYTKAKNASMAEYHMATALEAVIGFLYLSGEEERYRELITKGWEAHGIKVS